MRRARLDPVSGACQGFELSPIELARLLQLAAVKLRPTLPRCRCPPILGPPHPYAPSGRHSKSTNHVACPSSSLGVLIVNTAGSDGLYLVRLSVCILPLKPAVYYGKMEACLCCAVARPPSQTHFKYTNCCGGALP